MKSPTPIPHPIPRPIQPKNPFVAFEPSLPLVPSGYQIRFYIATRLYQWIRWLLGGMFLISGISKLMAPMQFARLIQAYGLVPPEFLFATAVGLSLIELISGLGLVLDLGWALTTISGQLVFFMVILGYGLYLGLDVDCGCFGANDPTGKAFHSLRPALYRDAFMLIGAGYLYYWRFNRR